QEHRLPGPRRGDNVADDMSFFVVVVGPHAIARYTVEHHEVVVPRPGFPIRRGVQRVAVAQDHSVLETTSEDGGSRARTRLPRAPRLPLSDQEGKRPELAGLCGKHLRGGQDSDRDPETHSLTQCRSPRVSPTPS